MQLCKAAGAKRAMQAQRERRLSLTAHGAGSRRTARGPYAERACTAPACRSMPTSRLSPYATRALRAPLLVEQLTAPVRWIELVQRLARDFPNALFVEMGPGSVLTWPGEEDRA